MQVETFIFRMKALDTDFSTYVGNMIIMILKNIIIDVQLVVQLKGNLTFIIQMLPHNCKRDIKIQINH